MNESNKSDMDASLEMENGVGNRMDTPRKGANGTDIHIDLHNGRQKQIRESLALSEVTSGQSDGIEENFGEQQKVGNYLADPAVPEMEQVEIRPQAPPRRRKIVDVSKQYLGRWIEPTKCIVWLYYYAVCHANDLFLSITLKPLGFPLRTVGELVYFKFYLL